MRLALALATIGATPLAHADTEQLGGPRLLHVPTARRTTEQGVLTPVPIALEIPADLPARRVLLHYHVFGAQEWRTLELHRQGARYVGAIPCLEVSEMTSEIRYYIRAHDAAGAVIAFSATRSNPYVVAIHHPSARPDLASVPCAARIQPNAHLAYPAAPARKSSAYLASTTAIARAA